MAKKRLHPPPERPPGAPWSDSYDDGYFERESERMWATYADLGEILYHYRIPTEIERLSGKLNLIGLTASGSAVILGLLLAANTGLPTWRAGMALALLSGLAAGMQWLAFNRILRFVLDGNMIGLPAPIEFHKNGVAVLRKCTRPKTVNDISDAYFWASCTSMSVIIPPKNRRRSWEWSINLKFKRPGVDASDDLMPAAIWTRLENKRSFQRALAIISEKTLEPMLKAAHEQLSSGAALDLGYGQTLTRTRLTVHTGSVLLNRIHSAELKGYKIDLYLKTTNTPDYWDTLDYEQFENPHLLLALLKEHIRDNASGRKKTHG